MGLWTKKSIAALQAEAAAADESGHGLRRALGALNLTTLGIGAIIGAGIFVLTGTAAANYAGPAIVYSFILAGMACLFAGLCYAEFASMIPIAGSAYTYGYATLGEFFAWIIGWDLILEYLLGASTVAVGWAGYLVEFLRKIGIPLPAEISGAPFAYVNGEFVRTESVVNLPAMLLIWAVASGAVPPAYLVWAVVGPALIWLAHADNIDRLLHGTERKFELGLLGGRRGGGAT